MAKGVFGRAVLGLALLGSDKEIHNRPKVKTAR